MSDFEWKVRYVRLSHAVRCFLAAERNGDFLETVNWRNQMMNVVEQIGEDDE